MSGEVEIRAAVDADVPTMAAIRAMEWESPSFWEGRIGSYLRGSHSPQQALAERIVWVAVHRDQIVGFAAGHRTRRFACDGELEWVNVAPEFRGKDIAGQLIRGMLTWFRQNGMNRICVNVSAENGTARKLYANHGAVPLSPGWMEWRNLRQSSLFAQVAIDN